VLDGIIELYMEKGASLPEIVAAGYAAATSTGWCG